MQCELALADLERWLREFEGRFLPHAAESPTRLGPTRTSQHTRR
jgi:hypothetical protein